MKRENQDDTRTGTRIHKEGRHTKYEDIMARDFWRQTFKLQ